MSDGSTSGLTDGICVSTVDGSVLYANPAAIQILALSEESSQTQLSSYLDADSVESFRAAMEIAGKNNPVKDHFFYVKSGPAIRLRWSIFPVVINDTLLAVHSINLERQVFGEQFNALSAEARLPLTMAHDLRNPLTTLMNISYLIEEKADSRHVTMMRKQLSLCDTIINNLLELTGARRLQRMNISVDDLMQEVIDSLAIPDSVVVKVVRNQNLHINVSPEQIKQALINIVQNAVEAIQRKGGEIKLMAESDGEEIKINIIDSGSGIPDEILPSLFEPMITTKEKGFGLGLYASKQLVEVNGGKVSYEKIPQEGCSFSVSFPRSKSAD